jgi:phage terminase large subunit
MIEERRKYSYKIEKRGARAGDVTNVPVDAFNHAWDAARYYAMEMLKPIRLVRKTLRGGT